METGSLPIKEHSNKEKRKGEKFGSQGIRQRCGKGIEDPQEQAVKERPFQGTQTAPGLRETLGEEEAKDHRGAPEAGQDPAAQGLINVIWTKKTSLSLTPCRSKNPGVSSGSWQNLSRPSIPSPESSMP